LRLPGFDLEEDHRLDLAAPDPVEDDVVDGVAHEARLGGVVAKPRQERRQVFQELPCEGRPASLAGIGSERLRGSPEAER
jgi:hypothetical protein